MLDEILSRLNSLEIITKLLVEVEKDQKSKMEQLTAQFHLYLRYHNGRWTQCASPNQEDSHNLPEA